MSFQIKLEIIHPDTPKNKMGRATVRGVVKQEFEKHHLTSTVKVPRNEDGNTEVIVYGGKKNIEAYLREFIAQDEQDFEFFAGQIEPQPASRKVATP